LNNLDVTTKSERVRFGSFEFDHTNGELRRDGMLIRLQAQPAMVLSHLLAYAGEAVSREELHHAIWGDDTFVDFERGLNVCIAQVRSALSDESTSPRFIRTVPRRGYQFIHPVEPISVAAPTEPDSEAARREFPWRTSLASLAGVALVVLLIVGFIQWRRNSQGASGPAVVAVIPFDNETGDASVNRFCSALTDNVIEQLTSASQNHYLVIGNAAVLRVPRERRDLVQIAASLHAQFVILGEVQGGGAQTRILAHLIHMPEQSHVWVVRLEQPFDDLFTLESTAARDIATEFSSKLADPALRTNLHAPATY
jgi:DNA-binding winged helix-turn-helix (wHTH) protein/TolB-like protein